MASKMKGIYKSFKYISQIFVVKERSEMEIGYPTDVKHVAHIGLDSSSPSGSAPSWMNEFKTAQSFGDASERRDSNSTAITALTHWSTHSQGYLSASDMSLEVPKKPKKKKSSKNSSSVKSSSSSSRRSKPNATFNSGEQIPSYHL